MVPISVQISRDTCLARQEAVSLPTGLGLHDRSEQSPDSRRERHCQCAPKRDPHGGLRHGCTAGVRPKPPRIARNTIDVPTTTGIIAVLGVTSTVTSGIAAPTAKVPAEANAA